MDGCSKALLIQSWPLHERNLFYFQPPELHKQQILHVQILIANQIMPATLGQGQIYGLGEGRLRPELSVTSV